MTLIKGNANALREDCFVVKVDCNRKLEAPHSTCPIVRHTRNSPNGPLTFITYCQRVKHYPNSSGNHGVDHHFHLRKVFTGNDAPDDTNAPLSLLQWQLLQDALIEAPSQSQAEEANLAQADSENADDDFTVLDLES